MGFGIATQTGISAAIQSIPSMMSNRGLRNGYGATFAANFTDGTNTLDPRITFSRASNATVTNSSGLIVNAPMNLLTFSEQFDNAAWTKTRSSITANTTAAPDGTTTADKLVEDTTASSTHFTRQTYTGSLITLTFSVYAKASERTKVNLQISNIFNDAVAATFDLSTGTVSAATSSNIDYTNPSAAILSVGNGWYRCSITATKGNVNTTNGCSVDLNNGSTTIYTGDGTSGAFIWGAQLELRNTVSAYNPTTVKNLVGFSEAFDNAAWNKNNSFVQTNLLTFSEQFDNAAWVKSNANITVTTNTAVAPNGTTTADTGTISTGGTDSAVVQSVTVANNSNTYTASFYAKRVASEAGLRYDLRFTGGTTTLNYACFVNWATLTTGVVFGGNTPLSTSMTFVENGWYRITVVAANNGTGNISASLFIYPSTSNNGLSVTAGSAYLWGAQLVQGATAGDYQQTTSAALPVQYAAPNGTLTAEKTVPNTTSTDHTIAQGSGSATAGTAYTLSVYAKADGYNFIRLSFGSAAGGGFTFFNLANGTVGATSGNTGTSIQNVGNGWYRCSITRATTVAGALSGDIYITSANNQFSWAGNGTDGVLLWGAQLSDSASLDLYVNNPVAAPTSAAYYGPRFDYDGATLAAKGLLIEEQRTNLIIRSEEFDNAAWTKINSSIVANSTISPDGTQDADTIVEDSSSSAKYCSATAASVTSGTSYTASVYAKNNGRLLQIAYFSASFGSNAWANFNLSTGVVGTVGSAATASITPVGNGWYRCSVTAPATATTTGAWSVYLVTNNNAGRAENYQGNGTSGIFVWGAQLEAGAFATSYIPTVASQVTRSADNTIVQGSNFSSWYNVNEGTVFEATQLSNLFATSRAGFDINSNSIDNRIVFRALTSGAADSTIIRSGNATVATLSNGTAPTTAPRKTAVAYKVDDFASSANGTIPATDNAGAVPVGVTQMLIGYEQGPAGYLNGYIRSIAYYPTRLQNSQLQAITQ